MLPRVSSPHALLGALTVAAAVLLGCGSSDDDLVPTITRLSPATISARGGEILTIEGRGFASGVHVRIGDTEIHDLESVSSREIRLETPPLFAGRPEVEITLPSGESGRAKVEVLPLDLRFAEAPPHALSTVAGETLRTAQIGDFDGDGTIDLVTIAEGGLCHLFTNDGKGNFTGPPEDGEEPLFPGGPYDIRAIAAADLDGDGDLDVVLGLGTPVSGASAVVYENDGSGAFVEAAWLPSADDTSAIVIADVDGDGRPDVVSLNTTPGGVPARAALNRSTKGSIVFQPAPDGFVPERDWVVSTAALADLDADGRLDLLLATPGAADGFGLRVLLGSEDGFREAPGSGLLFGTVTAVAAGDVDRNGSIDVVAAGLGQDRLLLNDGTGHFFDASIMALPLDGSPAASIALVDLDRDRVPDLLIGNQGAQSRLYRNDGSGRFRDLTPLLPIRSDDTVWVAAANVDGDADTDLLVLNASQNPARLYLSVEPSSHDAP